ncbi:MAG: 2-keto-4-pentenoate hydratase [Oligoflexia bacterium]
MNHDSLATLLHTARLEAREIKPLTHAHPELSVSEAYDIQAAGIRLREQDGEKITAYKMGLTSEGKRRQMGLHEAIFGVLTDRMQLSFGAPYRLSGQIHPKAEPEIALRLAAPLSGHLSADEAWALVDQVAPAIEVLDSRFVGFKYFSLRDVIADNASSSQFLIGRAMLRPSHWRDLERMRLSFKVNGRLMHQAQATEISGSPIRSLMDLGRLVQARGITVPAGSWVLLGAATPAVGLEPAMQVELELDTPAGGTQRLGLGVV